MNSFGLIKIFAFFWQIGELFEGHFSWRGLLQLGLFVVMALVIIGFTGFAGYQAFRSKKGN